MGRTSVAGSAYGYTDRPPCVCLAVRRRKNVRDGPGSRDRVGGQIEEDVMRMLMFLLFCEYASKQISKQVKQWILMDAWMDAWMHVRG